MSRFEERKPEEIRAWLEESDIAQELRAHLAEVRANNVHMIIQVARNSGNGAKFAGVIDFIDGLNGIFDRKPEKK